MSGDESELLLDLSAEKDVRARCESARNRLGLGSRKAFTLEDDRKLVCLPFRELIDLAALVGDLGGVQTLFGLAGKVRASTHRDRASHGLRQPSDDDQRAAWIRGRHARHDPEGHQQAVLRAEHELADAREPGDARRLAEGMLLDVPKSVGASRRAIDRIAIVLRRQGAFAATGRFVLTPAAYAVDTGTEVPLPISGGSAWSTVPVDVFIASQVSHVSATMPMPA